jgi:hypothetical protein
VKLKPRALLLVLLFGAAGQAPAGDSAPGLARYKPLYPGLYFSGGYTQDDRDSVFDADGTEVATAVPSLASPTSFPEKRCEADFTWYFPMWEGLDVPFFSSRLHTASARLRYIETRTEGALADFAADPNDDNNTQADLLENNGSGIGDLTLEFGSVLIGSPDWRRGARAGFAVTGLIGLVLPMGDYNRDAAINAGDNHPILQAALGAHWQPWAAGFFDLGVAHRAHYENYDAHFGALSPTEAGDELILDASYSHRILPGLYLTAFGRRREGDPNRYASPRFAPNRPPHEGASDQSDTQPTPGDYFDNGTELTVAGLSAHYFVAQNWLAAVHYTQPQSGRSGQFQLPFTTHTPPQCVPGATSCTTEPGPVITADGLGSARTFANDTLMFTLTHLFGLGDTFTCTGCERE